MYPFSKMSKPSLGPTKPPILGLEGPDIQVSTPFILVLRLTISGAVPLLPLYACKELQGQLYFSEHTERDTCGSGSQFFRLLGCYANH